MMKTRVELAEARNLDALHLATALLVADGTGDPVVVLTLDDRMRQSARKVGLDVLPA